MLVGLRQLASDPAQNLVATMRCQSCVERKTKIAEVGEGVWSRGSDLGLVDQVVKLMETFNGNALGAERRDDWLHQNSSLNEIGWRVQERVIAILQLQRYRTH